MVSIIFSSKVPLRTSLTQIWILFLIIIFSSSFEKAEGAKILFFLGFSSHSHRVAIQPLATKLADIGHEVTFLSPIKPEVKNPKIKEFCPQALLELNEKFSSDYGSESVIARLNDKYFDPFFNDFGNFIWGVNYNFQQATLQSPDFLEWVEKSSFDLIITEHPSKEISLGLAHKYGAKVIAFSPATVCAPDADMFGWSPESSWLPGMPMESRYSFIPSRYTYEFYTVAWYSYYKWVYLPKVNSLIKSFFKPDENVPHIQDLIKNINLYFINIHFSSDFARSLPPFVIPVGGMHVKESNTKLPQDIEDFIQAKGRDGFIYISFGSFLKVSALPKKTRNDFFEAIRSFKNVSFLMKWEEERPEDLPENILPMKWFPQQDVLAHPKCRGFISQGGLMSFQQATYNGVPVIIIPIFGDQPLNSRIAAHHGTGMYVELADLTLDTFSNVIGELLYNESYSAKAKEVAKRFKDRPMSPVDTAVWWTEYALRHNDTSHLKPLGIQQEWWQRRQLDFWAIVFTAVVLFVYIIVSILCRLVRFGMWRLLQKNSEEKVKRS